MKKKLNRKIIVGFVLLCLLMLLGGVIFHIYVSKKLDLTKTFIASHTIEPRSKIEEKDLIEIEIPRAYLLDYAYHTKEEIIGKYTDIQGIIPAGSAFYKSMLYDAKDLVDQSSTLLKEGQTAYTFSSDLSKMASITTGNRVDIFVNIMNDKQSLSGCLFENARVISVKDFKGLRLDDINSTGIPNYVEIALNRDDLALLMIAESKGEIRLFLSDNQSDRNEEASLIEDGEIYQFLTKKSDKK